MLSSWLEVIGDRATDRWLSSYHIVRKIGPTVVAQSSGWTSLEIVKLVVGSLTPIFLFVPDVMSTRAANRVEEAQWASRTLIERRLELHKEMAPRLNQLLRFFTWIGDFRIIDPPMAIRIKRELDRTFFANKQLFGPGFDERYLTFIDSIFEPWSGSGHAAKLKTSADRFRIERGRKIEWNEEWDGLFSARPGDPKPQLHAYNELMEFFATEVGVQRNSTSRRRPGGVKIHRRCPLHGVAPRRCAVACGHASRGYAVHDGDRELCPRNAEVTGWR
jgi:hypothetical protein